MTAKEYMAEVTGVKPKSKKTEKESVQELIVEARRLVEVEQRHQKKLMAEHKFLLGLTGWERFCMWMAFGGNWWRHITFKLSGDNAVKAKGWGCE